MKAICVTFTIRPYLWVRNAAFVCIALFALVVPQRVGHAADRIVTTVGSPATLYRAHQIRIIHEELTLRADDLSADEIREVALTIVDEAMVAKYDPLFVVAIIEAESNFRVEAVSSSGARGLMQIVPSTFRAVSDARRMFDPVENVRAGIRYLAHLNSFKRIDSVLLAYNQGPGTAKDVLSNGRNMPHEATIYVPRVTAKYKLLLERYGRNPKLAHKSFRVGPTDYATLLSSKASGENLPRSRTLASTP